MECQSQSQSQSQKLVDEIVDESWDDVQELLSNAGAGSGAGQPRLFEEVVESPWITISPSAHGRDYPNLRWSI